MSDLPNPALFTSLTRLPAPPAYASFTIILSQQAYVAQKPGDRPGQAKLAIDESCAINARSNRKPVLAILPAKSKGGLAAGGSRLRNVAACNQCRKQRSRCNGNSQTQEPLTRCSQMGKFCINRKFNESRKFMSSILSPASILCSSRPSASFEELFSNSYSQLLNNQDSDFETYDPQQLDCLQPYLHLGIYQPGSSDALNQKLLANGFSTT
ncbi:hypothetical protein L204_106128 [Cryptococcus depauperatus]